MTNTFAILRLSTLLVVLALTALGVGLIGVDSALEWLTSVADSPWGPVAFISAYVVLIVLMLPGSIGTVAAGAVFGTWLGFFTALAGATIGACLAFGVARAVGRDGAVAVLGSKARAADRLIEDHGFVGIIVLRLLPIVPFNALNYAAGLSNLSFGRYAAGTAIGMIPGTFIVASLASGADNPSSPGFAASVASAVLALVASVYAAKRLRAVMVDDDAQDRESAV
ncbi:MAG: TVP38/TMEM64 family protein [Acidimicrobiales bacterium]